MNNRLTMSDRLGDFIKSSGLTDKEFSKKIGATRQQLSDWKHGRPIPLGRLSDIIEAFPVFNSHWLLSGHGQMLNEFDGKEKVEQLNTCSDPFCVHEREVMKSDLDKLKQEIISLQKEKIAWLEKVH